MITINDTALNDNQLIFVVRISLDGSTLRYATRAITLSGNAYSDSVLLRVDFSTLNSISKNIDIYNGGGVGSLSAFEFSLSNFSGAYISEFYPSTSKPYLTSRKVEVGFLWSGATTEGEITWINSYYINSVRVEANKITCLCIELSDIETIDLPYYEVQKDFDNEMSYFPNAPEENLGTPIPIVYGDLSTPELLKTGRAHISVTRFVPVICIDNSRLSFIVSSHKVFETSFGIEESRYYVEKYISGIDTYVHCWNASYNGVAVNSDIRHYLTLQDGLSIGEILGNLHIRLKEIDKNHTAVSVDNVIDKSETRGLLTTDTYETIDAGEVVSLRSGASASSGEVGILSQECYILYRYSSEDANSRNLEFRVRNEMLDVPAQVRGTAGSISGTTQTQFAYVFGNVTTAKKDGTLPWTVEEICGLSFLFKNAETIPGNEVRLYDMTIALYNIKVYSLVGRIVGTVGAPPINLGGINFNLPFK